MNFDNFFALNYNTSYEGFNQSNNVTFDSDCTWHDALDKYIDFLKSCGYIITEEELKEWVCDN